MPGNPWTPLRRWARAELLIAAAAVAAAVYRLVRGPDRLRWLDLALPSVGVFGALLAEYWFLRSRERAEGGPVRRRRSNPFDYVPPELRSRRKRRQD
jgi:hypothetical protein